MKKYYLHLILITLGIGFYFLGNIQRVAVPGAIFNLLQAEFNVSAPYITALGSSFMYVYALNQLTVGLLADRYGGIRVIMCGSVVFCIGVILFPLSHSLVMLYFSRALIGLGAGTFYLSMVKEIKKCFADKNFGLALSVMMLIGYAGGIVANAPFVFCVDNIGWRSSLELIAAVAVIFTFAFLITGNIFKPGPINYNVNFGITSFKRVFENKHNINLFIFAALNFGLYYLLLCVAGKKFLEDFTGLSSSDSAIFLSIAAVISAFAGLGAASLSKICRNRKTIFLKICATTCTLVFLSIFLCLLFDFKTPILGVLLCLLAPGASMSPIIVPLIYSTNPYEISGTAVSIMNCAFYLTVGVLANIAGFLMNVFPPTVSVSGVRLYGKESYTILFGVLFALSLIEIYNAFKLREPLCKQRIK